jgi:hypothetical protein
MMTTKKWFVLVLVTYFLVQLLGHNSQALTDDDDFYIPAGISYASWWGEALSFSEGAWEKKRIDQAFKPNREHPPFAKYVFGACHFALRGLLGPTDSARMGSVLFSTLIAGLLFFLCVTHLGPHRGKRAGIFSVVMLLTMPRFYTHSHAATLDVPVAAMYLWAATLALRAERSSKAALWAGPVFGLATATKLNAPFMLLAYVPFVLLTRTSKGMKSPGQGFQLISFPAALASMATLGPIVFFAIWPWMWTDLVVRVKEYVGFHLNHYGIHFLYFGQVHTDAPYAPWHAPFVMAGSTIPVVTTVFALAGLFYGYSQIRLRMKFREGPDDERRKEGDLLLFTALNVIATIGIVAFAGTPFYGGEKLFMPFFPFWCLLAGYGANVFYERIQALIKPTKIRAALVLLLCSSGLMFQIHYYGYGLSQYNGLVGGVRGATALGFERQYYDLAFRDLVALLSKEGQKDLKVHFLPNNWEYVRTYKWYRRAQELRQDIVVTKDEGAADWIIITHERRFARYAKDLQRYRSHEILYEKRIDGTPIWTVLKGR